jgi:hypothetical protein
MLIVVSYYPSRSFNLMIHEYEKDYKYWIWYILGNGGMCGMLIYSLL